MVDKASRFFVTMCVFGIISACIGVFSESAWFGGAAIAFGISATIDIIWVETGGE